MSLFARFRVLFVAFVVFVGLTVSCSNDEPEETGLGSVAVSTQPEPEPEPEPPVTQPPSSVGVSDADLDELAVIWQDMFTATGLPFEEREPALEALGVLDDELVEAAASLLFESEQAQAYTYPKFSRRSDGVVRIDDCVIYQPMIWESVTHQHAGEAVRTEDGGWSIIGLNRTTRYCAPAELAQGALEGYNAYREAVREFWNPPDPDHPGIEATLTGIQLEVIPGRIAENQREGNFSVDLDTSYPEVVDVKGPDRIVISDCREIHPESGLYDSNGDKFEDAPKSIFRNRYITEMQLTDQGWKTASIPSIDVEDDCAHAPTPAGRTLI